MTLLPPMDGMRVLASFVDVCTAAVRAEQTVFGV